MNWWQCGSKGAEGQSVRRRKAEALVLTPSLSRDGGKAPPPLAFQGRRGTDLPTLTLIYLKGKGRGQTLTSILTPTLISSQEEEQAQFSPFFIIEGGTKSQLAPFFFTRSNPGLPTPTLMSLQRKMTGLILPLTVLHEEE